MDSEFHLIENKKELFKALNALHPVVKHIQKNERVMHKEDTHNQIAFLIQGIAYLTTEDDQAERHILEVFESGDILSHTMLLNLNNPVCYMTAKTPCKIAYIDYQNLLSGDRKALLVWKPIVLYAFQDTNRKALEHTVILQQKTLRNKLLQYFYCQQRKHQSDQFSLIISFSDLADYLSVNRSSLMREIRLMNEEHIIQSYRRSITLQQKPVFGDL